MDCTDIKVLLSGLVDDELDAETRHAAERHLAECEHCRALVDEAETLNQLVVAEAEWSAPSENLPENFVGGVLNRTSWAGRLRHVGGAGWINWLGWLAAAACLVLAVTIWALDHRWLPLPADRGDHPVAQRPASTPHHLRSVSHPYQARGRSWVFEGEVSDAALAAHARPEPEADDDTHRPVGQTPPAPASTIGAQSALVPSDPSPLGDAQPTVTTRQHDTITREDAETLDATALLLQMLLVSKPDSFADVERIRQIAEYDELLHRLADARSRLRALDRGVVFAAEGVLLRIVHGPINQDDLRALRDDVQDADLPARLTMISAQWQAGGTI